MRRSRCATTPGDGTVKAKVVVVEVQSNYNNAAANRLGVVPDTTDVHCKDPIPFPFEMSPMRIVLSSSGMGAPPLSPTNWPT